MIGEVGELVCTPSAGCGLTQPLTGFENHGGRTELGPDARPLATVDRGVGNGTPDRAEGVLQGHIAGTYMHGPALARNPALADLLISWAVGTAVPAIDDSWPTKLRSERLAAIR